jgi:hypothetical protein
MRKSVHGFGVGILMGSILFLMLLLSSFNANAQWVSIVPPEVSSSWGLSKGRILPSGTDGWVVGTDVANKRGVIIQAKQGDWIPIEPPNVSSDWELNATGFTSGNNAWAVGVDYSSGSRQGVILHFQNGLWSIVTPPYVSVDWALYDVSFTGSNDGWVVGYDYANKRGILLHFISNVWVSYTPPDVGRDWGLNGVMMINSREGWAVGVDHTNKRGVILHYTRDLTIKSTTKATYTWQIYLPPQINGDWELNTVSFPSTAEGWAIGVNHTEKRGMILHFVTPRWDEVFPPPISSDFEFNFATFPTTYIGWISGIDYANKKGILLQYDNRVWFDSVLPEISSDWMLGNVRYAASDQIWAFGTDVKNKQGIILRYSVNTKETISTPSKPNGPTHIASNALSTFYTGESKSNLSHSVQYIFDWGDGTDSGWLPVGTVGASKSWTSPGTYLVKAQARCDTDTFAVSKLSSELSVTVSDTPTTVTLVSPADGTFYTACSLYDLPTFTWKSDGSFTDYEVQFSKYASFDTIDASKKTSSTSISMDNTQWKKVIDANGTTAPGSSGPATSGGPMFWRVIGTRSDKVSVISNTLSFVIARAQEVENATIIDTGKSFLPTLSWDNQCGVKFSVRFGNNPFFTHQYSITFNIKNPNDNGGVFTQTLTDSQWTAVQNVTGRVTGTTVYWYVDSRDGADRRAITTPNMFFVIAD